MKLKAHRLVLANPIGFAIYERVEDWDHSKRRLSGKFVVVALGIEDGVPMVRPATPGEEPDSLRKAFPLSDEALVRVHPWTFCQRLAWQLYERLVAEAFAFEDSLVGRRS